MAPFLRTFSLVAAWAGCMNVSVLANISDDYSEEARLEVEQNVARMDQAINDHLSSAEIDRTHANHTDKKMKFHLEEQQKKEKQLTDGKKKKNEEENEDVEEEPKETTMEAEEELNKEEAKQETICKKIKRFFEGFMKCFN